MALTPTFQSMLAQAKDGEPEALDRLYTTFYPRVSNYVSYHMSQYSNYRISFQDPLIEDIVHDVFEEMLIHISNLRISSEIAFVAWLYKLARTAMAKYYRERDKMVQVVQFDTAFDVFSPDDPTIPILEAEKSTALAGAISMLTTKRRKVVIGRVVEGKPARTLAQQLGKSEAAVYHDQYRALATLRKDKNVRQWIIRIIIIFAGIASCFYAGIAVVSQAGPGNLLYPVKLWAMPAGDSGVGSHRDTFPSLPIFTPTIAPTPTITPTPSPTPIPVTRPSQTTSGTKGSILNSVATALPVTSSDSTPITCVLDACVSLP